MKVVCRLNVIFGGALAFALLFSGNNLTATITLNDDVVIEGSATIEEWLEVQGDDGVLFKGSFGQGIIPTEGQGTRLMWYQGKGALRAGSLTSWAPNQWNDNNIGENSVAFGRDTRASGDRSMAVGDFVEATGPNSIAFGNWTGTGSSGWGAIAGGSDSYASGSGSLAIGEFVSAAGSMAAAFGDLTSASGRGAFAAGWASMAAADYSTALGDDTRAQAYASVAIGRYNVGGASSGGDTQWNEEDPLFEIGIGQNSSSRANAMTVYKDGRTEFSNTVRIEPSGDIGMGQFTSEP